MFTRPLEIFTIGIYNREYLLGPKESFAVAADYPAEEGQCHTRGSWAPSSTFPSWPPI
jgi:hypothetical protein